MKTVVKKKKFANPDRVVFRETDKVELIAKSKSSMSAGVDKEHIDAVMIVLGYDGSNLRVKHPVLGEISFNEGRFAHTAL